MANGTYEYQSDFARRYVAQGEAKGRAESKAEAVLAVLSARSLGVSPELRARIMSCTDLATLDTWLTRAVTAVAAVDVVGE